MNRQVYASGKEYKNLPLIKRKYAGDHKKEINEVIDKFDFKRVHAFMTAVNWQWHLGGSQRVPSIYELEKTARGLLESIVADVHIEESRTGGFCVYWMQDEEAYELHLDFILTSSSVMSNRDMVNE